MKYTLKNTVVDAVYYDGSPEAEFEIKSANPNILGSGVAMGVYDCGALKSNIRLGQYVCFYEDGSIETYDKAAFESLFEAVKEKKKASE